MGFWMVLVRFLGWFWEVLGDHHPSETPVGVESVPNGAISNIHTIHHTLATSVTSENPCYSNLWAQSVPKVCQNSAPKLEVDLEAHLEVDLGLSFVSFRLLWAPKITNPGAKELDLHARRGRK